MIEKLEFYHGAALVRIVEDPRCEAIQKRDSAYIVNTDSAVLVKYTTKAHSPWRFTLNSDDIERFNEVADRFEGCTLALVCAGDGVCGVSWQTARDLIGDVPGWLAAKRGFSGCYSLSGPIGKLNRKVPLNRWPSIVFEQEVE
jgi:hypothetical protein